MNAQPTEGWSSGPGPNAGPASGPAPGGPGGPGDDVGPPLSIRGAVTLVVLPTVVLAALGLWPLVALHGRLPDPLATHWGLQGGPNGATSWGAQVVIVTAALVLCAVVTAWAARRAMRTERGLDVYAVVVALPVAGIICSFSAVIAWVNRDHASWHEVPSLPVWTVVAGIVVPLLVTGAVARSLPRPTLHLGGGTAWQPVGPAQPLSPDERVVWIQSMVNLWMLVPSLVVMLAGLVAAVIATSRLFGLILLLVGLATTTLASIQVTVDRRGLRIAYGPLRFPRTHIPRERITAADVIDVHPSQWGGWGYRGSLKLMKRAAVVLRGGPGIHLVLRDGSEFAVTIPHPETGVALLNRLLASAPA